MKEIKLTQGKVAVVDDDDFNFLSQHRWHYMTVGYAARRDGRVGWKVVYLHRLIIGAKKGEEVDHINGNTLDCRKGNLRIVNRSHNMANTCLRSTNTSGYKGVSFDKRRNKWYAEITVNYKKIHLGRYVDIIEAAKVYNEAAKKYFGEFARLNAMR